MLKQTRRRRAAQVDAAGNLSLPFNFSEYEHERAAAVGAYEAQQASDILSVRRFRNDFLDGRTLSPAEARALVTPEDLDSPSPRTEFLSELRRRATNLAKQLGWELDEAAWLLLTGLKYRQPVDVGYRDKRIQLSAAPWVPAETVLQIYRLYQRYLLRGDNRPIGVDKIALFRFVIEHSADGKRPTWRTLLNAWNNAHPEWRYVNEKRLARDFGRIKRTLLATPVAI